MIISRYNHHGPQQAGFNATERSTYYGPFGWITIESSSSSNAWITTDLMLTGSSAENLIFLNQLRYAVDQAIKHELAKGGK